MTDDRGRLPLEQGAKRAMHIYARRLIILVLVAAVTFLLIAAFAVSQWFRL